MKATLREFKKETGLIAESEDLKFLFNNSNYNCNVYILKIHLNTELDLMKSDKNEEWEKFFFEIYERMAREDHTTSIHTTYILSIVLESNLTRIN